MLSVIEFIVLCGLFAMTPAAAQPMDKARQEAYLKRFNHLGVMNPDPRMAALQSDPDAQFQMAVRSFQRFAGLPMTGEVDGNTMQMMQTPRCGVADLQNNMGGVARRRRRRYTAPGDKWKQTALTYRFPSGYTPDISRDTTRREIEKALQLWSAVSPLKFTETSQLSDIEITFAGTANHGDNAPFDGPGGTLAHAYFPGLGIGGDVHFDDSETYTSETSQGTNLLQVATHELGHSLGLGHSENQDAIMAPFYRGYKPNLTLHADDISGIQYLYGGPTTTKTPGIVPKVTTPPPRPTIDTGSSVSAFCRDPVFDAIDIVNGSIHVFYGDNYLELDDNGHIRPGFPKPIAHTFPGLPGSLDAVLSLECTPKGDVYFFKGTSYYSYNRKRPRELRGPLSISNTFSANGGLTSVDAAFIWSGNGQTYFIKGNNTYRHYISSNGRGQTFSPRPLSEWKDLPSPISDAFQHVSNRRTYFFSGKRLYNFNDKDFRVQFIEDTYDWMHCCGIRVKELEAMHLSSTARVINASFISKIVAAAVASYYISQTAK